MAAIETSVMGLQRLIQRWKTIQSTALPRLVARMQLEMNQLAEYIRVNKLSGQVLKNRTGTLRRSIHGQARAEGDSQVVGIVGTNVKYAKYFETTGTKPHDIVPVRAKALHWVTPGGQDVFARRVHHPGFAARPFMRPALEERRTVIIAGLRTELGAIFRDA
jgi:phage gpG-like protein